MASVSLNAWQDVSALIAEDFSPSMQVYLHKTSAGKLCSCCKAAHATFKASVIAAAGRSDDGLHGVLSHLTRVFRWGICFPHFLCEMLQTPQELDCGAMTALAMLAVQLYVEHVRCQGSPAQIASAEDLVVCNVQLVFRDDPSNVSLLLREVQARFGANSSLYNRWLRGGCMYHQCLGLCRRSSRQLLVWDYGKLEMSDSSVFQGAGGVLGIAAIKVNMADGKAREMLRWQGHTHVVANEWNVLQTQSSSSESTTQSSSAQSSLVGSPTPLPLLDSAEQSSHSGSGSGVLRVFVSACHMSGNPNP
eukprot:gene39178-47669_t